MPTHQTPYSHLDHDAIEQAMWNGRKLRSRTLGQSWRQLKAVLTHSRKNTTQSPAVDSGQPDNCTA